MNRFIKDEEVSLLFSVADLVVQPYKSATQSGVTQVAFHFEKPMLVTDVGGLKEIVPHGRCGYVVSPDPSSIADAMNDFFSNNRKDEFARCVREEKQKFSWDKMTRTISGLLSMKFEISQSSILSYPGSGIYSCQMMSGLLIHPGILSGKEMTR